MVNISNLFNNLALALLIFWFRPVCAAFFYNSDLVYIKKNTDLMKSFEIEYLISKRQI